MAEFLSDTEIRGAPTWSSGPVSRRGRERHGEDADIGGVGEPGHVGVYGDSITQGTLHTHGLRSYVEHVHEHVRGQLGRVQDVVVSTGVGGHQTGNLCPHLGPRVFRFAPEVVAPRWAANSGAVLLLQTPRPVVPGSGLDRSDLPAYGDVVRRRPPSATSPWSITTRTGLEPAPCPTTGSPTPSTRTGGDVSSSPPR